MTFTDRTVPQGLGPMTGRGGRYCSGFTGPGYMNPVTGRGLFGFGRGRGRGRVVFGRGYGWRRCYWASGVPVRARWDYDPPPFGYTRGITEKQGMEILNDQAAFLK